MSQKLFCVESLLLDALGPAQAQSSPKRKQWSFSKAAKKQAEMQAEMLEQDTWAVQNLATLCNIWT